MRALLYKIIRYSGLPIFFREVFQKHKVTIIFFHAPKPQDFDRILKYLTKHYNVISLKSFVEHLYQKDDSLPPKALIITLDDGWKENYKLLRIVKKYRIPITIFLCAGIVGTNRHFWWTHTVSECNTSYLKSLPNTERLKRLKDLGFEETKEYIERQALSLEEINEMKEYVDFQSHTLFHPSLPRCSDEEAEKEIFESKKLLERILKKEIYAIAYPFGDYSEREVVLSKKAGYKCALTVDYGFNDIHTDPFRLKRLSISDSGNIDEVIVKACGVWMWFKRLVVRDMGYGYERIK